MKKVYLLVVLLAGLALQPVVTQAGDHDRRLPVYAGNMEWRLGASHRGRGSEIYYRLPGERRWIRAPGAALDLGDGWVIGTDRRNGGYGIYRWAGRDWQRMPGAGVQIGGSYHNPWVINDRGERFSWTGSGWRQEASRGRPGGHGNNDRFDRHDNGWRNGKGR